MVKRLQDNKPLVKDLFLAVDCEGDGNGSISMDEFKLLGKRMNISLSNHRCTEIYAAVQPESDGKDKN